MSDRDAGWTLEPLGNRHLRGPFDSGIQVLNDFLRKYARQNEERGISRTYVALRGEDPRVLGFYTLRIGAVATELFPPEEIRRLPRYPVPVTHLARLAVDLTVRGQGLGGILLVSALHKSWDASRVAAAYAVEVIAKTDEARRFYQKHGFAPFKDDPLHLYMPMERIRKLFA